MAPSFLTPGMIDCHYVFDAKSNETNTIDLIDLRILGSVSHKPAAVALHNECHRIEAISGSDRMYLLKVC